MLSGFRVPCIVASPFSRIGGTQAAVNHNFYDHTSVLKLIEWRWGLQPLTARDASHAPTDPGNLATLLNFRRPVTKVPKLPGAGQLHPDRLRRIDHDDGRRDGHGSRRPRPGQHLDRPGPIAPDGRLDLTHGAGRGAPQPRQGAGLAAPGKRDEGRRPPPQD